MEILKSAAETDLTPEEQALFDVAKPIPADVTHVVARERTLKDVTTWLVIGAIALVVGIFGLAFWVDELRHPGKTTIASSDFSGNALVAGIIGFFIGSGSLWGVLSEIRRIRDQGQGVPNRFGLFLMRDALLVRLDARSVTRLPRKAIVTCEMVEEKKAEGKVDSFGRIVYNGTDGKEATVRLSDDLSDQPAGLAAAVAAVSKWLAPAS